MSQPEVTNTRPVSIKDDKTIYTDENRPNVRKERYFRCNVITHPDESAWIFVSDTIHTPIRFHRDFEVILPEWAVEILKGAKFTQMVARFAPFQKSVPYFPKKTQRFMPQVIEEVSYDDYVKFRDGQEQKPLPSAEENN